MHVFALIHLLFVFDSHLHGQQVLGEPLFGIARVLAFGYLLDQDRILEFPGPLDPIVLVVGVADHHALPHEIILGLTEAIHEGAFLERMGDSFRAFGERLLDSLNVRDIGGVHVVGLGGSVLGFLGLHPVLDRGFVLEQLRVQDPGAGGMALPAHRQVLQLADTVEVLAQGQALLLLLTVWMARRLAGLTDVDVGFGLHHPEGA